MAWHTNNNNTKLYENMVAVTWSGNGFACLLCHTKIEPIWSAYKCSRACTHIHTLKFIPFALWLSGISTLEWEWACQGCFFFNEHSRWFVRIVVMSGFIFLKLKFPLVFMPFFGMMFMRMTRVAKTIANSAFAFPLLLNLCKMMKLNS